MRGNGAHSQESNYLTHSISFRELGPGSVFGTCCPSRPVRTSLFHTQEKRRLPVRPSDALVSQTASGRSGLPFCAQNQALRS